MGLSSDEHRAAIKHLLSALPPPLHDRAICKGCPHPQDCRNRPCLNDLARSFLQQNNFPNLMLPAQAIAFEKALRGGKSVRMLTVGGNCGRPIVSLDKFNKHAAAYPVWAARIHLLAENSAIICAQNKGHYRKRTHCANGHEMPDKPNYWDTGKGRWYRRCLICKAENIKRSHVPAEDIIGKVVVRLLLGQSPWSFTQAGADNYLLPHKNFVALRRAFPQIGQLVIRMRKERKKPRARNNDSARLSGIIAGAEDPIYSAINAALPKSTDRDVRGVVINEMWIAVKEGQLEISEIPQRVKEFVSSYYKLFPQKYAPPSLDAPAYRDGPTPLIETISEGLW